MAGREGGGDEGKLDVFRFFHGRAGFGSSGCGVRVGVMGCGVSGCGGAGLFHRYEDLIVFLYFDRAGVAVFVFSCCAG